MNLVDADNRYVYKGSVTTPPCGQSVYWNVLSTIYPIKQEYLDLFKAQLARADQGDLAETGNWREIQMIDEHNIVKVTSEDDSEMFAIFDDYYEEIMGEPMDENTKEQVNAVAGIAEGFINDQAGATQIVMGLVSSALMIAMTLY